MKHIKATDAAKGFGQLVDDAQQEPITIEKNGRPVAVVYSYREAQEIEAMKTAELKRLVDEGLRDIEEGRVQPFTREALEEIKTEGRRRHEESRNT